MARKAKPPPGEVDWSAILCETERVMERMHLDRTFMLSVAMSYVLCGIELGHICLPARAPGAEATGTE